MNILSCKTARQTAFKYSDNRGVQLAYFVVEIIMADDVFQYYPQISEGVSSDEEVDGSKSLPFRLDCYVYHYNP